jgi:aldehyde:ferredoxin oxidoreductase
MECYEDGLITSNETEGVELRFGNAEAMVGLVEKIALREGFGRLLADGSYRAGEKLGREALARVVHVKKQEVPMHDPRIKYGLNIGYAISPTGADHNHSFHDTRYATDAVIGVVKPLGIHEPLRIDDLSPAKIRLVKRWINQRGFQNSVGLCSFMGYDLHAQREIVAAATGWDFSIFEIEEIGERVIDMARCFNYRCGFRAQDDAPPSRFYEPVDNGPNEGTFIPEEVMAQALGVYYDMMGWDHETGAPLPWKLHEMGLGWLVE